MDRGNVFANLPAATDDEVCDDLIRRPGVRIERILSEGQSSPPGFWYDQEGHEWVMVLRGRAGLEFADDGRVVEMDPGDWVDLPAHCKHRVAWTADDEPTVWLAVHY